MGVHDYVCFVQKNGQSLEQFDMCYEQGEEVYEDWSPGANDGFNTGCGNTDCNIALVPKDVDVGSLQYTDFAKYEVLHWTYSWDRWGFDEEGEDEQGNGYYYKALDRDNTDNSV
jgi:hypothetical protein